MLAVPGLEVEPVTSGPAMMTARIMKMLSRDVSSMRELEELGGAQKPSARPPRSSNLSPRQWEKKTRERVDAPRSWVERTTSHPEA